MPSRTTTPTVEPATDQAPAASNGNGNSLAGQRAALEAQLASIMAAEAAEAEAARKAALAEAMAVITPFVTELSAAIEAGDVPAALAAHTAIKAPLTQVARDVNVRAPRSSGGSADGGYQPAEKPRGAAWEAFVDWAPYGLTASATGGNGMTVGEIRTALAEATGHTWSSGHLGNVLTTATYHYGHAVESTGSTVIRAFECNAPGTTRRVMWGERTTVVETAEGTPVPTATTATTTTTGTTE